MPWNLALCSSSQMSHILCHIQIWCVIIDVKSEATHLDMPCYRLKRHSHRKNSCSNTATRNAKEYSTMYWSWEVEKKRCHEMAKNSIGQSSTLSIKWWISPVETRINPEHSYTWMNFENRAGLEWHEADYETRVLVLPSAITFIQTGCWELSNKYWCICEKLCPVNLKGSGWMWIYSDSFLAQYLSP